MASHKKLGEFFGKIPDVAFFSLTRVHSQYNLNSLLPLKSNRFFHPARTSAAGGISSSPLFAGLAEHSSPPSSIDRPKPVSHELDSHPSKEISPLKTLQASPQTCPGEVSLLSSPVEAERWETSRRVMCRGAGPNILWDHRDFHLCKQVLRIARTLWRHLSDGPPN